MSTVSHAPGGLWWCVSLLNNPWIKQLSLVIADYVMIQLRKHSQQAICVAYRRPSYQRQRIESSHSNNNVWSCYWSSACWSSLMHGAPWGWANVTLCTDIRVLISGRSNLIAEDPQFSIKWKLTINNLHSALIHLNKHTHTRSLCQLLWVPWKKC